MNNYRNRPTAIDLFAGCGGCSVGLRQAGFEVLGAIEIDSLALEVYRANHPKVRLWCRDIAAVHGGDLLKDLDMEPGELDLLAGCPPCQGFSTVRTLNGGRCIEDARNDLISHFERLVRELRPKAVMLENVPALAQDNRLKRFTTTLHSLGYVINAAVLNAADYGVAQRRRRFMLLAGFNLAIPFAEPSRRRRTVRDVIGSLKPAGKSGDAVHDLPEFRTENIKRLIAMIPKNGGSRTSLPIQYQLRCHQRCNGFKDIYGRMAWDRVSPTLTTGCFNPSRGRFLHPEADRAITMREAALLQSFPSAYKFPANLGKTRLASMIGNALPPRFVRSHAKSVFKHLPNITRR
jgi:DNA (cytosine-5)-methyltransferase 1